MSEVYPEDENMGFEDRLTEAVDNFVKKCGLPEQGDTTSFLPISLLLAKVERLERENERMRTALKYILEAKYLDGCKALAESALSEIEK